MTIIKKIKIGRLRWVGHVVRMDPHDLGKCLFLYNPDGKRKVGRPKLRLRDGARKKAERAIGG